MLKPIKEIFIKTDKGEYHTYGYMRVMSGVKIMEAHVPKSIVQYIDSGEPQHMNAQKWWKAVFIPLIMPGGKIYKEGKAGYDQVGGIVKENVVELSDTEREEIEAKRAARVAEIKAKLPKEDTAKKQRANNIKKGIIKKSA